MTYKTTRALRHGRSFSLYGTLAARCAATLCAAGLALAAPAAAKAQSAEPRLLIPLPGTAGGTSGSSVAPSPPSSAPAPVESTRTPPLAASPGSSSAGASAAGVSAAGGAPAASPAFARLDVRMTQLEEDLRSVTGRLEEVSFQLRKLDDRLNKLSSDIDYRLSQTGAAANGSAAAATPARPAESQAGTATSAPAAGGAAGAGAVLSTPRTIGQLSPEEADAARAHTAAAGAATPPAAAAPQQTASIAPSTPREQYAAAFSQLEKRNYSEAAAGFTDFLRKNPNDPLADNARYWLGESYYARGDYARSAELFLDAYDKNKTGPKAPETLLKLGLSLSGLDKKKEACASFRELARAFPNAPATIKDRAAKESRRLTCS